jgi:MYND finger
MSNLCKRPNCALLGTSHCSACQNEWYCSVECQRANWKDHKITCGKKLLSETELDEFLVDSIKEASTFDLTVRNGSNISFLKNAILITEYQFGERVTNECHRHLKNGEIYKNDLLLFSLRYMYAKYYINQNTTNSFDIALGYAIETREELEMRRRNEDDQDFFFDSIYKVNTQLGDIYRMKMQYEESLYHSQEALAAARHSGYINDGKPSNLILALILNSMSYSHFSSDTEQGFKFAEEAYLLTSGQHGPDHPDVQEAATHLVETYLEIGNFVDAERFARIGYESLINPTNPIIRKDPSFALKKLLMATVWVRTPIDQRIGGSEATEEAETLAREACDLLEAFARGKSRHHPIVTVLLQSLNILINVMTERGKKSSEVEKTILRALSFTKDCRGGVVPRLVSSFSRYNFLDLLADLVFKSACQISRSSLKFIRLLQKAKYAYEETVMIATALFGSDSVNLTISVARLREIDQMLSGCAKK